MIVRGSISFKRGLDPKKSMDIGISRKGNEKEWIKRGLESVLHEFAPKYSIIRSSDGSKQFVNYYDKSWLHSDPENMKMVFINTNNYRWDSRYQKYSKDKIKNWMQKNGLKIDRLFKNRNSNRYELYFKLD
jgi:hypothetical protein